MILAEEGVTYSVGDRFKLSGYKYIISNLCDFNMVNVVNLTDGASRAGKKSVADVRRITQSELYLIFGCETPSRYWDARKQCEV